MRFSMMILLAVSGCTLAQPAHALTFPDRGRAAVVDTAHVMPDAAREALNAKIVGWNKATGHQLAVLTVPDMQGADVKDYGYQLGRTWALGDKQRNDGVILLLAMKEHKVRIEVGYGLEPVLTDALTSVILSERVVPRLRDGNPALALNDGADAIMQAATPARAQDVDRNPGGRATAARVAVPRQILLGLMTILLVAGVGVWTVVQRMQRDERRRRRDEERARAASRVSGLYQPPHEFRQPYQADDSRFVRPASRSAESGHSARAAAVAPDPSPSYSGWSPSPSYSAPSPSSSSSSSDSGSSSSGFDSGGGSFGGGGSDSSW